MRSETSLREITGRRENCANGNWGDGRKGRGEMDGWICGGEMEEMQGRGDYCESFDNA
jgi:hypothetical protein